MARSEGVVSACGTQAQTLKPHAGAARSPFRDLNSGEAVLGLIKGRNFRLSHFEAELDFVKRKYFITDF